MAFPTYPYNWQLPVFQSLHQFQPQSNWTRQNYQTEIHHPNLPSNHAQPEHEQYRYTNRTFDPASIALFGVPTRHPNKLTRYSPKWGWTRLFNFSPESKSYWRPLMNSMVVAVSSARTYTADDAQCKPQSETAYSVLFGENSANNISDRVSLEQDQNFTYATLIATREALRKIRDMRDAGSFNHFSTFHPVIKTDSEHVANCLAKWVWEWKAHNWMTAVGEKVQYSNLIREIDDIICDLESPSAKLTIHVRFWCVHRRWNTEARKLAMAVLERTIQSTEEDKATEEEVQKEVDIVVPVA